MNVSILIPVVRPDRATECINYAVKNSGINVANIEVLAEEDTERIGCPKMIKRMVENAKNDLVVFLGDDTLPEESYLKIALDRMKLFPNGIGLVGFNDGVWDGDKDMSTHWLAHKALLQHIGGEFFHTGYIHCRCDRELAERTRALDRYAWEPKAKIVHMHPITMGRKDLMDEDYNRVYRPWAVQHDIELYEHRKANGWQTKGFHQVFLDSFYLKLSQAKTDINEHMPTLKHYASKVKRVTEFGMRNGISTVALLSGRPKAMTSYDINPQCLNVYRHLKQIIHDTDFKFVCGNTLEIPQIEETDFLFIDSLHDHNQLQKELTIHGSQATTYIGFHDTETFGHVDESGGGLGLKPAIQEFAVRNKWKIESEYTNNNGLIILKRK